jgi:proteic killer suppression protein
MLNKFKNKNTERFANGERIKQFEPFHRQIEKRLEILEAATCIEDLMRLPSNRFEALKGDRKGQFSIRVNERLRICFVWPVGSSHAYEIEIVDYH